jgi:hypothetical protein
MRSVTCLDLMAFFFSAHPDSRQGTFPFHKPAKMTGHKLHKKTGLNPVIFADAPDQLHQGTFGCHGGSPIMELVLEVSCQQPGAFRLTELRRK